jgi:hypothetical protein
MSEQWKQLLGGYGQDNTSIPSQLSMNFYPGEQHDQSIPMPPNFTGFGEMETFDAGTRSKQK